MPVLAAQLTESISGDSEMGKKYIHLFIMIGKQHLSKQYLPISEWIKGKLDREIY